MAAGCTSLDSAAGALVVDYSATVTGVAEPLGADELELLTYLQPSRYCESDRLQSLAHTEFGGLTGKALLDGVSSWVGMHLAYVAGSSQPTDGAVETLLAGRGVCRDYAHLTVALLRGLEVPGARRCGVRAGAGADGLPRRRRGVSRRELAGRRPDAARTA